jgi:hypothetical protein
MGLFFLLIFIDFPRYGLVSQEKRSSTIRAWPLGRTDTGLTTEHDSC